MSWNVDPTQLPAKVRMPAMPLTIRPIERIVFIEWNPNERIQGPTAV